MDIEKEVLRAEQKIRPYIRETPLEYSPYFSQIGGSQAFLKLENLQYTGSFKARGAMNKLLYLTSEQRAAGCVAASTGNHGAAVAFGLRTVAANGLIFVPENASPTKVEAIRRLGGQIQFHGLDGAITEAYARSYAEAHDMVYISPYNDPQIIGGQGTIAVELIRQVDQINQGHQKGYQINQFNQIHAVFVALGGGGLITGIAGYLKSIFKPVKVIGCSPENSQVMAESVQANQILDLPSRPTLSDGTAGGIEAGAITFDLCRRLVDDYIAVSEDEIKAAMRLFMDTHHMLLEGAAGVAIAAYLKQKEIWAGKNVVIIICGANISLAALKTVLA